MAEASPRVSVVIPAWNEAAILPQCLESVLPSTYRDFGIVVVDNGSTDDTSSMIARRFPGVKVIRNPQNIGFGGALNQGSDSAGGELLVWLNADASLDPEWMGTLVGAFDMDPRLGMLSSVVLYRDLTNVVWSAGGCVDGTTGLTWDHGKGEDVSVVRPLPDPDYTPACAVMIRREALAAAGGLDPRYFIYFEDADLGLRMRGAGYKQTILGSVVVRHGATRRSGLRKDVGRKLHLFVRSNLRFVLKNWPIGRLPLAMTACLGFYLAYAMAKGPRSYVPPIVQALAWNVRHLDETRDCRPERRRIELPHSQLPELWSLVVRLARRTELFPY